jgi:hypothetical protein
MELRLRNLILENVKGLKSFDFSPDGQNALIRAENGKGKTTVYDGWLWLLDDKNSDGKADFNIRPLDEKNQPINGLIVAVEAELLINGETHVLRKEEHEHITKSGKVSYPTECKIDEIPKLVGKYQEFIENLVPEEIFKMLTDLAYFNGKMHWSARRKVLFDIAGKIPKPAGFETLLKNLNGRDIDDYKRVLTDRLKAYEKERDQIQPRIDELQRGLDEYVQNADEGKLQKQRDGVQNTIDALNTQRDELLAAEKQRQKTIEEINRLTVARLYRESQLKNDTSGQKYLLDEKANLEKQFYNQQEKLRAVDNQIRTITADIESVQNSIEQSQLTLESIREEFKQVDTDTCPTCGQQWPQDKPKPGQADITKRGNSIKASINDYKKQRATLETQLLNLNEQQKNMAERLVIFKQEMDVRTAEIDKALKNRPEIDPATDKQWQKLTVDIEAKQKELGKPVLEQLDVIETNVKAAQEKLNEINKSLAQADNMKKAKARIIELEARQRELAQLIADTDGELDQIQQYKMQESKMISAAVNGRFKHVEWKLFDYYLNGEINDKVCDAVYQGVPYPDMSSGQKIFCGIDIINTLSDHYGVSVPIFIDHAESITMPIESDSQTISLRATIMFLCIQCGKFSYRDNMPDEVGQIECDYCQGTARRYKELKVEVEKETVTA